MKQRSGTGQLESTVAALLVLPVLLFWATGHAAWTTLVAVFSGPFGSTLGISEVLAHLPAVLLCALAAAVPGNVGLINIGGEGQLQAGVIAAAFYLQVVSGVSPAALFGGALIVAALGGGLWSLLPAVSRAWLGVNESLISLFLNYVSFHLLNYLVHGPLRDAASFGWPMGPAIPEAAALVRYGAYGVHAGVAIALVILIAIALLYRSSRQGFELRAIGRNAVAASVVRIPVRRWIAASFIAGGMLAGLAGCIELSAIQHKLRPDVSLGFGYSGFLIAWISRGKLLLLLPLSILVSALITGASSLQVTGGLPSSTADIFEGLILLLVLLAQRIRERRSQARALEIVAKGIA